MNRHYNRKIILEDGGEFYGYSFGTDREAIAEIVSSWTGVPVLKLTEAESARLLEENGEYEKDPGMMASAMSWLTTEMKMMVKRSDTEIAKIMMNGCNMGIQTIAEKAHEFENASQESKKLAEKIVKEEEDFMKKLKEYL